jgi:hypothetical protein
VADKCHYVTDQQSPSNDSNHWFWKLKLEAEDELDGGEAPVEHVTHDDIAFRAMGYMPSSFIFNLSRPVEVCGHDPLN